MTPPLALLFGPQVAVPVVLLLEAFAGVPMLRDALAKVSWRLLAPIGIAACITVPIGGYVLVNADQMMLRRGIAATVFVFALVLLSGSATGGRTGRVVRWRSACSPATMLGATGIGGPPVILYLLSGPDPVPVTRANLTLYVVLLSVAGLVMLGARGLLNAGSVSITLPLAVPFFAGVVLGGRLFTHFSEQRFRQFTLLLLLAVSVGILLA